MGSVTIIGASGGGGGDTLASFRTDYRVAYYDCSDDGTNGLQDSEGTNHLTENVSSAATFGNTGVNGDCIGFTGSNDRFYLQSSNICPNASQDLTISFWMNTTDGFTRVPWIYSANSSGSSNPRLALQYNATDQTRPVFQNTIFGEGHPGGNTINDGNWHHHLFVMRRAKDGDPLCMCYVDGKLVGDKNTDVAYDYSSGYFIFGRTTGTYLNALIDEIEIFMGVGAIPSESVIAEMAAEY